MFDQYLLEVEKLLAELGPFLFDQDLYKSNFIKIKKTSFIYMEKWFLPRMLSDWILLQDGEKTEWENI